MSYFPNLQVFMCLEGIFLIDFCNAIYQYKYNFKKLHILISRILK